MSLTAENCLLCGQLHIQEKGKTWTKVWAAVTRTEPLVLYLQSSGQVKAECIYTTVVFKCSWEVIFIDSFHQYGHPESDLRHILYRLEMLLHSLLRLDSHKSLDSQSFSELLALPELTTDAHLSSQSIHGCLSSKLVGMLFPRADPLVFHSEQHRREVSLLKPSLVLFPGVISQSSCRTLPFQRLGLMGIGWDFPDYTQTKKKSGGGQHGKILKLSHAAWMCFNVMPVNFTCILIVKITLTWKAHNKDFPPDLFWLV